MSAQNSVSTAPERGIADQFVQDLETFEQCERQMMREDRLERARQLRSRFVNLDLKIGD